MKPRIAITCGPDRGGEAPFSRYRAAVENAGGEPVLVSGIERGLVGKALSGYDGLLLPGGHDLDPETYGGRPHESIQLDHPDRDALELEAARYASRSGLPTFAICRGLQVVNVALGGTLYQDIEDQYEAPNGLRLRHQQTPDHSRSDTTHEVDLTPGSRLAQIASAAAIATNTLHHQAPRRIAYSLQVTGRARDGIVEALELRGEHPFFVAVQWHPEELVERDAPSRDLFAEFIRAAQRFAAGREAAAPTRVSPGR
jgi:putative glutamine amidotransferase